MNAGICAAKLYTSIGCSKTVYMYWMQYNCLHPRCFQCLQWSSWSKQWMEAYMQPNCIKILQVFGKASLHASKVFPVPTIIIIKQHWMQTYMHSNCMQELKAPKLFANFDCSITACNLRVFSASNYCIEATMDAGIYAAKLYASVGCRQFVCKYWMKHHCMHPKFFHCLKLLL